MTDEKAFKLLQDGVVVAEAYAPNRESALREIQHYALVYGQDGPVQILERVKVGKIVRWISPPSD